MNTYGYAGGNPIRFFDTFGLDYGFGVDPAAAAGNGHTTLYFQNVQGDWFAYNEGAAGATSSGEGNVQFLIGLDAPAGVSIQPISAPPARALIYPSSKLQDALITSCAVKSQQAHNSGKKKYNLYSNNCTDAAVDVTSCAGIKVPNPAFTVRPNSWIKLLEKSKKH